ncbi:hypothetical protein COCON_G00000150 [Conger conger]|uniref:ADP-ribosylhydrolase ARH3 n=1 Tax=Conger conger TaxID=82655 RepID=A0A9Q1I819_CONCO|nr:hypothetical protein COCON_G00000150 [Conger conger]
MTATAAARLGAGGTASRSRFRGALVGAVLGDCLGGEFEGAEEVPMDRVLQHLSGLDQDGDCILQYSDDTAMTRCVVQSLLTRGGFDQQDMAHRFAEEYRQSPGRGYGSGVVQVLRKLSSPRLSDVFQPARAQFAGRGSFGNGGAMRAAPFALAFRNIADVKRGALQPPQDFINTLISQMEEVESEDQARSDARALNEPDLPFCARLHRVKELMEQDSVSIEEVISKLGNGIAALHSVPTAIFCVLHCLEPRAGLPEQYGGLERTVAFCLALGGDTDTIACMAGAIAGAHCGAAAIPPAWQRCSEGAEEAQAWAHRLHLLYRQPPPGGDGDTQRSNTQPATQSE